MRNICILSATIFLAGLVFSCGQNQWSSREPDTGDYKGAPILVAEVEGEKIFGYNLRWELRHDEYRTLKASSPKKAREEALRKLVNERLIYLHAHSIGLDRDGEFRERQKPVMVSWLARLYLDRELAPTISITDDDLAGLVPSSPVSLRLSMIVTRSKEKSDAALGEIRKGKPFGDVAREYGIHPTIAAKGGDIGWVMENTNYFRKYNLENIVMKLSEGDVTESFQDSLGWVVLKCEQRKALSEAELEKLKEGPRNAIRLKKIEAMIKGIVAHYEPVTFSDKLGGDDNPVIAKVGEYEITKSELINFAKYVEHGGEAEIQEDGLEKYIHRYVRNVSLYLVAKAAEYDKKEFVRRLFDNYEREKLSGFFIQKKRAGVIISPGDENDYYERNPESFIDQEKVWVRSLILDSLEDADEAISMILNGIKFEDVAKRYGKGKAPQIMGPLSPGMGGTNGHKIPIFSLKVGEVSKVIPMGNKFFIGKVVKREESGQIPLAEARPLVKRKITEEKLTEQIQLLLDDLRGKYDVKIYRENLKKVELLG